MKNINYIFRFCFLLTFAFISFSSVATSQDVCILDIAVNGSSDDAEESGDGSGNVSLTSSDLEMTYDGTREYQMVGIRFNDVQIPNGATINNAYIQFTAEESDAGQTVLTIRGENTDNATTFSEENFNISTRTTTSASVSWTPTAWNTIGEAGADQQTADIASIIEEIISLNDWNPGNSIAIIITGAEKRSAVAYDGNASEAPVLHIEFSCDNEPVPCDDDDPSTIDVVDIDGNCLHFKKVCDDGNPQTYDFFDNDGNCVSKLIVCDDGDEETIDYLDEYGVCHHVKTVVEPCDECPDDPNKTAPGECGCGNPDPGTACDDGNDNTANDKINGDCQCEGELDTDLDGTPDDNDGCPTDADKTEPGDCGCGNPETDTDEDGTPDCVDLCPDDSNKTEPGECGCGNLEPGAACDDGNDCTIDDVIDEACECKGVLADSDGDGTPDCDDLCPNDSDKTTPGECGCGNSDLDLDGDGVIDCVMDECPNDPDKTEPGLCGCGTPDTDTDGDGTPDCNDWCPDDPNKIEDGQCGCGNPETDTDGDGTPDCDDPCPHDPEDECEAPDSTCSDLEGCENEVTFVTCDEVVVCTGEKINQIVVDLGPTGFQHFSIDPKFTAINDTHWEYTAPAGETIQGIWVKTKGYCDKCGDEDAFSCLDCEGAPCPRGNGGGRYYKNTQDDCAADNSQGVDSNSINLNLYPNPASQQLFVKLRNKLKQRGRVQILNTNGDRIYDRGIDEWTGDNLSIDLGNSPHGLYFLRVTFDNGTVLTRQFVLAQ